MNRLSNNNPNWKGDKATRQGQHKWIRANKPKPKFCECCKINPPYDVANISQKYYRDINDYEWLCRKCHMHKDGRIKNLKIGQPSGKNHPLYGKPRSDEVKRKISETKLRRKKNE